MTELARLEDVFSRMRTETSWNVDGPMLWGYFFVDSSGERLEMAAMHLAALGYRFVRTYEADDGKRWLHVERVETHSPQTLSLRNGALRKVADQLGLDCYDGWDVGPVHS